MEITPKWVEEIMESMRRALESISNQVGGSRHVPTPTEVGDCNDDDVKVSLTREGK